MAIVDTNDAYKVVLTRGRSLSKQEAANVTLISWQRKYLGAEKYPFHSPSDQRVLLKINPEKIFEMKP